MEANPPLHLAAVKTCCAALYASDWARVLLGDSFHPGGLRLTERLGELLRLGPGCRVLDVASGKGASPIHLARHFGCHVVGVEYGAKAVAADTAGVANRVRFAAGDAELLPAADGDFDVVICECAFCTFPDKRAAAAEFARVLRPGGRVGLSDLTRYGALPSELENLLGWIACVADAQPIDRYAAYLKGAGFVIEATEPHDDALGELVGTIRARLLGAELMVRLNELELPGVDLEQAKQVARGAAEAVRKGTLGYAIIIGTKRAA